MESFCGKRGCGKRGYGKDVGVVGGQREEKEM